MKYLKYLPYFLIPIAIIFNILSETQSLFGTNSKQISDLNQILLTPAPITFAIWGVIYIFLLYHLGWSFAVGRKTGDNKLQLLVSASMIFNIAWLALWHSFIPFSRNVGAVNQGTIDNNLAILIFSLIVIMIYTIANFLTLMEFRKLTIPTDKLSMDLSKANFFGLGIHFSWVFLATLLNLAIVIKFAMVNYSLNIDTSWESILAMLFIALIVVLTYYFVCNVKILAFGVVSTWALFGMLYAQNGWSNLTLAILLGAICCVAILAYELWNLKTN